jgi:hypothetical protein
LVVIDIQSVTLFHGLIRWKKIKKKNKFYLGIRYIISIPYFIRRGYV